MNPSTAAAVVAVGIAFGLGGYLVGERRWHFLIASIGLPGPSVSPLVGRTLGSYGEVIGVVTVALGVLAYFGIESGVVWMAYAVGVCLSAFTLPFWAPQYVQWRVGESTS